MAEVGQVIVRRTDGQAKDALLLTEHIEKTWNGTTLRASPGLFSNAWAPVEGYYTFVGYTNSSPTIEWRSLWGASDQLFGGISVRTSDPSKAWLWVKRGSTPYAVPIDTHAIVWTNCVEEGSVRTKELRYSGKSGSTIRLLYRETHQDKMQQQELTFDLNESNTVVTQGALIRVQEAAPSSLTYIVIKAFD